MVIKEVTTNELLLLTKDQHSRIIDIRSADAYNGWPLQQELRGGHIKGARSLPFHWTKYIDWIEMVRHKHLFPDHHIIVYGYDSSAIQEVALRFINSGYHHVSVYNRFVEEWSANPALPMDHLRHFKNLLPAEWLKGFIAGTKPMFFDNDKVVIIQAHYRNREAYLSGHIPGAIDMDTLAVEDPETWNRRNPHELKDALEAHGISTDTTVILYGKYMSPDNRDPFPGMAAGDIGALRCAFILMYAGVKDVRVLNGGFQSWVDRGYEVSYEDVPKNRVENFGARIPQHPEYAVDMPEARMILASPGAELVCVRSWPEYIGEVSGYHYIQNKGRIPGAVFAEGGSDAYHMENFRNFDLTCREYHEIAEGWINNGITPEKHLAFYCGTGWRGSEAWFNAWLMGWPRISVYDGGWFEWSADPKNPVEKGIPSVKSNITFSDLLSSGDNQDMISEIIRGLSAGQKYILPRFFYDTAGSVLFEEITALPEYYLTRIEKSILKEAAGEILNGWSFDQIIELGSGDCSKISIFLERMPDETIKKVTYIPVDINKTTVLKSAETLSTNYPGLRVQGLIVDFLRNMEMIPGKGKKMICFFGSTIGNLSKPEAISFLLQIKSRMDPGDCLLVGFDRTKDIQVLEAAYNDDQGITAAFNKNILKVVNQVVNTNFDLSKFKHLAFYNPDKKGIEMHLQADSAITVSSPYLASALTLEPGETILTEISHKYDADDIQQLAEASGLKVESMYTDESQQFYLVHFR